VRQIIISLLLIIIIVVAKNINISATNYITDKVKYIINYNVELKSVFSYIDNLAADIKKSISPEAVEEPALNGKQDLKVNSTTTDMQNSEDIQTLPETLTSSATESSGMNEVVITEPAVDAPKTHSNSKNEENDDTGIGDDAVTIPQTAVLSASSEAGLLPVDMLIPVEGTIGSLFGEKINSITGNKKMHNGIDIDAKSGSDVKSAHDGAIMASGASPEYGNYVRITHTGGLETVYANCSRVIAKKGQSVKMGDIIATIGDADIFTGSHLHFEIWRDGNAVDPLEYISVPYR